MHKTILIPVLFILALATGLAPALAASGKSDQAKEKRWAAQIEDGLLDGEIVWLTPRGQQTKFLGIYTRETAKTAQGGAILLHGMGVHPDWPDVIFPLRTGLPEYGWNTLSIQMPVLDNEAAFTDYAPLFDEVAPRIDAAIALLKSKGINNIVLIGHSLGSVMGAYYLANHAKANIRAFVGIGMSWSRKQERMNTPALLARIKIPVLDIYGEQDLFPVLDSVERRANAANAGGNAHYYQLRVPGADHFFRDNEETLVKRVGGWLNRFAAGEELPAK